MSNTVSAHGLTAIRVRDRRRVRRSPAGAIGFAPAELKTVSMVQEERLIANDDLRQFLMSFSAFFTAAMIFLA